MSTKTTFKRVALVAVAALGIGMLSAIPSYAAPTVSNANGYAASSNNSTSQVVGGQVGVLIVTGASDNTTNVAFSGVGSIVSNTATPTHADATSPAVVSSTTPNFSINYASETDTLTVTSSTAGTSTITATPLNSNGSPGTAVTYTITWGSAAVVGVQYTKVGTGTTSTTMSDANSGTFTRASSLSGSAAVVANTPVFYIAVQPYDTSGTTMGGTEKLTASITGPGTLAIGAGTGANGYFTPTTGGSQGRALTGVAGAYGITVYGDGTAGSSTVTISDGAVVLATIPVVFTGNASSATATQNLFVLKAGGIGDALALSGHQYQGAQSAADQTTVLNTSSGATGLPAITVFTKDAGGSAVTLSAFDSTKIKVVSSNSAVLTAGTCARATSSSAATNEINCLVTGTVGAASGSTATATVELADSTGAFSILATPLTFTIGGSVASMVLTTDAATYAPLSPMTLTVTAKDSAGNKPYDQDGTLISPISSTTQISGLASPTKLVNGVGTKGSMYAPQIGGAFTISGTDNLSAAAETVSATATVTGGSGSSADVQAAIDAANAATDAANYAADAADAATTAAQEATAAAQAAQDSADAATAAVVALGLRVNVLMASVRAQLTSLSNLLVRIIKKTHA